MDPACEVSERGTRDENDGNEVVEKCDLPLDLELTERVEIDDETLPYAEKDSDCPEQTKEHILFFHSSWKHDRSRKEGIRKSTTCMARISSKPE